MFGRAPLWMGASLCLAASAALARPRPEPVQPNATTPVSHPLVAEGDAAYAQRDEGHVGDRADPRRILEAIAAYEAAARDADDVEARWKLARALYFRGGYTSLEPGPRRAVFEEARNVSEQAIAILGRRARAARIDGLPPQRIAEILRPDPDAAPTFFWRSVAWGEWALSVGKLEAARMGAAARIRDDARVLIALDPRFEQGGGYRILGRLHDQAPKIPMLTWWVSRKDALANLRRSLEIAPTNLINLHFLAEALARGSSSQRAEAIGLEERVIAQPPSPAHLVEELHVQEEAKRNLAEWRK